MKAREWNTNLEYLIRSADKLSEFLETEKEEQITSIDISLRDMCDGYPKIKIGTKSKRIYHYAIIEGTLLRWRPEKIEEPEGNGEHILKDYELLIALPEKPQNLKRD